MKQVTKGKIQAGGLPDDAQLALINQQAKSPLNAEEVYVFSLRVCDDQPDRDGERFDTAALGPLAELLVGKTCLCDHHWSAQEQVARIFAAKVEQTEGVSFIRAWAYVLRAHQEKLIDEIEGGIRKEVSIGCAVNRRSCSICGAEMGQCAHRAGEVYDGQRCLVVLSEPVDAYEVSFVAVPAQPEAGVLKKGLKPGMSLEQLAKEAGGSAWDGYRAMQEEINTVRKRQREELVRLGLALEMGLDRPVLERMAAAVNPDDLTKICRAWNTVLQTLYPPQVQLCAAEPPARDEAFVI